MLDDPLAELGLLTFPRIEDMDLHPDDYGELALLDGQLYGLAARQAIDDVARSHIVGRLEAIMDRLPRGSKAHPYIKVLIKIANYPEYRSKGQHENRHVH